MVEVGTVNVRPNTFLVGAMKSGTTYLAALMSEHPQVFFADPKEPSYFVAPEQLRKIYPWMWKKGIWRSESRYLDLFAAAGDAPIVAEGSTNYTKLPRLTGVAERLHRFDPDCRIIYLMRDPVERSISHYWFAARFENEERDLMTAIREDDLLQSVSDYASQLEPYFALFNRERIKCLTFEALRDNPRHTLAELWTWLGVDPTFEPASMGIARNVASSELKQVTRLRRVLRETAVYGRLKRFVPRTALDLARRVTSRTVSKNSLEREDVVRYLRARQLEQVSRLETLLGRRFPEWTTLYEGGGVPQ